MTTLDFHRHRSNGHRTETRSPQTGGADAHASVGQLVQQASRQLTDLVRAEMRLAQTEMTQKGKRFGAGGGMLAAAGVFGFLALATLVTAAVAAIAAELPLWASALIIAGALLLITAVMAMVGRSMIRKATPAAPRRTMASVRTDVAEIKERTRR
ncbi:phage holin family protein [Streptomyces chilikensis]|uniref:phage holin family protein n=1 Tax=Streptomyces chilikensis TaxID=1194079 RepID=UPI00140A7AF0|nr:phage holin family protein [Streptomyces chilikensis]